MTTWTTAPPAAVTADRSVRTGTVLALAGIAAEYAVTQLHPSHEDPDDHSAVFPEYAASDDWIAVHLGQFAAGLLVLLGILTLLAGLRSAGAPRLVVRAGSAAAVVARSVPSVRPSRPRVPRPTRPRRRLRPPCPERRPESC